MRPPAAADASLSSHVTGTGRSPVGWAQTGDPSAVRKFAERPPRPSKSDCRMSLAHRTPPPESRSATPSGKWSRIVGPIRKPATASGAVAICPVSTTAETGWPATIATRSAGEFTEIRSHFSGLRSPAVSLNADADGVSPGMPATIILGLDTL